LVVIEKLLKALRSDAFKSFLGFDLSAKRCTMIAIAANDLTIKN
jgi:hypothetical protein